MFLRGGPLRGPCEAPRLDITLGLICEVLLYIDLYKILYREWKFETQLNLRIWGHDREISWKFDFLPIYASHNYNFYISVKLWS